MPARHQRAVGSQAPERWPSLPALTPRPHSPPSPAPLPIPGSGCLTPAPPLPPAARWRPTAGRADPCTRAAGSPTHPAPRPRRPSTPPCPYYPRCGEAGLSAAMRGPGWRRSDLARPARAMVHAPAVRALPTARPAAPNASGPGLTLRRLPDLGPCPRPRRPPLLCRPRAGGVHAHAVVAGAGALAALGRRPGSAVGRGPRCRPGYRPPGGRRADMARPGICGAPLGFSRPVATAGARRGRLAGGGPLCPARLSPQGAGGGRGRWKG